MKIHEWLAGLSSHAIYDTEELDRGFREETGKTPCWRVHSIAQTRGAIIRRGIGGFCEGPEHTTVAWGHEVAEALAKEYAGSTDYDRYHGRGRRFEAALEALKQRDV